MSKTNPLAAIMGDENWAQVELATVLAEIQDVINTIHPEHYNGTARNVRQRLEAILRPNNRAALVDRYRQQGRN